jgi:O-succinylbenzoic acid--CoA ligase
VREFPDWLASRAATVPERLALSVGDERWTFAALRSEADRIAGRLASYGVEQGDRVATLLPNGFAAAVMPHATLRLGATLVPLNTRLTKSEIDWQLGDVKPRILIDDASMLEGPGTPNAKLRTIHPADAALAVIYTSGTTGNPKGATLTVGNFWWSAVGSALNLGVVPDDCWLACLPLFHVGGLSIITRAAIYGISAEVHEGFDAASVNRAIDDRGVTIVSVVSVMLQRMLDERGDKPFPSSLRCVLLGGGPAPLPLLERCAALRVPVVQTYGLTETCSQIATLAPDDAVRKLGSAGKPLYPNEIRISAEDEIEVRGPVVTAGYFGRPDETARAIADGWLHTGDAGRLDNDGFLYVLDRRDDLIVTGGENVYPAEVESALSSHPSIAEVAVVGVHDGEWGQRVVAVIRSSANVDAAALTMHCESRIARFKIPREFHFSDEPLPRTAAGKLRRSVVREKLAQLPVNAARA